MIPCPATDGIIRMNVNNVAAIDEEEQMPSESFYNN